MTAADALMTELAWTRRLARGLVSDRDEADDLAQDTIAAAIDRPPEERDGLRPWLATVARNLLSDRRRSGTRRARREAVAVDSWSEAPPTPEESLARVQEQRRVAGRVASLEEPYRQAVILRYFEGLSAADIARTLGLPAGTVRWRLKVGMDRLRAEMDAAHGGNRGAWVALLLPRGEAALVSAGTGAAAGAAGVARTVRRASALRRVALLLVILGGASLPLRPWRWLRPDDAGVVSQVSSGGEGRGGRRSPAHAAFLAATSVEDLGACRARIAPLWAEVKAAERAVLEKASLAQLFERGEPNPVADAAIRPIIDGALSVLPEPLEGYTFECRSYACCLSYLAPAGRRGTREAIQAALVPGLRDHSRQSEAVGRVRQQRTVVATRRVAVSSPVQEINVREKPATSPDVLSGQRFEEVKLYYALEDREGRPVPRATLAAGEPQFRRAVHQAALAAAAPPLPGTLPQCRKVLNALAMRLARAEAELRERLPLRAQFADGSPNPALTAHIAARARAVLEPEGVKWSPQVECRDWICRLTGPADAPTGWQAAFSRTFWDVPGGERSSRAENVLFLGFDPQPAIHDTPSEEQRAARAADRTFDIRVARDRLCDESELVHQGRLQTIARYERFLAEARLSTVQKEALAVAMLALGTDSEDILLGRYHGLPADEQLVREHGSPAAAQREMARRRCLGRARHILDERQFQLFHRQMRQDLAGLVGPLFLDGPPAPCP
jgi:RNA polymerase sigma factor (sigma-70 family)